MHQMLGLRKHVDDEAQEHSSWRWMRMEFQESVVRLRKSVRLKLRPTLFKSLSLTPPGSVSVAWIREKVSWAPRRGAPALGGRPPGRFLLIFIGLSGLKAWGINKRHSGTCSLPVTFYGAFPSPSMMPGDERERQKFDPPSGSKPHWFWQGLLASFMHDPSRRKACTGLLHRCISRGSPQTIGPRDLKTAPISRAIRGGWGKQGI